MQPMLALAPSLLTICVAFKAPPQNSEGLGRKARSSETLQIEACWVAFCQGWDSNSERSAYRKLCSCYHSCPSRVWSCGRVAEAPSGTRGPQSEQAEAGIPLTVAR